VQLRSVPVDYAAVKTGPIIKALGGDLRRWTNRCHEASLLIVRSGLLPAEARVARGTHPMVRSQHSWVTIGDPYLKDTVIVDATLWYHLDRPRPQIIIERARYLPHRPKGHGSIWEYGKPADPTGPIITLKADLSAHAQAFLKLAAPNGLDARGWAMLANAPVCGWPASEIIAAIADDDRIAAYVPIDILGMVTDRNPGGLYR
jgi:hypothetical protein